ncbi:DNA polymerase III subunit delta [Thorsellia kenyensis]|uniref:DNA polymerase III subunit delta n=1 Tax=Thorsellia kenyensis TaxID=1549888 RepID=A0ABV6CA90_9GAMM
MIKIDADKFLNTQYTQNNNAHIIKQKYLINGNEPLLIFESSQKITALAKSLEFTEYHLFTIEAKTDWNEIFSLCEGMSLFSQKLIIYLNLPDSALGTSITEKLSILDTLIHEDIILIFTYPRSAYPLEKLKWFKDFFADNSLIINCQPPTREQLPQWVTQRQNRLGLKLEHEAILSLCYHYEGNLLALNQILQQIQLLFGEKPVSKMQLENILFDAAHFTSTHFVDAALSGSLKRAFHIAKQLQDEEFEIIILLRQLQSELMQLIKIKSQHPPADLRVIFDNLNIWKNRRPLYTQTLQRLNFVDIAKAIEMLSEIEIKAKTIVSDSLWKDLLDIVILLSNKPHLPKSF